MPTFRAPRGTRDLLPAETAGLGPRSSGSPPTSPRATATARSRRRCSSRARSSSAGSARSPTSSRRSCSGSRRATEESRVVGAPAGADGGHRPGLRPARDADLAAAGEADDDRADVPLRPAAGRPLPPVLAVRRRGDRRSRARRSTPRSSSSATRFYRDAGLAGVEVLSTRSATRLPAGLRRGARRPTTAATPTRAAGRSSAAGSSATRCASSTRRTRRWPR